MTRQHDPHDRGSIDEFKDGLERFHVAITSAADIFQRFSRALDVALQDHSHIDTKDCRACGKPDLDHWFTSKRDGTTLCEACFTVRCGTGLAKEDPQ